MSMQILAIHYMRSNVLPTEHAFGQLQKIKHKGPRGTYTGTLLFVTYLSAYSMHAHAQLNY